ncbi:MAG: purine-binding chemotaxis protein CheW [Deltaproteobacteria bacterium]|nr:purine-binding chemotaxis protein CheW [Deltaproteobacteria bacterium]
MASDTKPYIPFAIGRTTCILPVSEVRETLQLRPITPVYRMPPTIRGLIQVRGEIFPVLEIGRLLGIPPAEIPDHKRIVVACLGERVAGILTSSVHGTIEIADESFETVPHNVGSDAASFLTAVARTPLGVVGRLSLDRVFSSEKLRPAT